MDAALLSTVVFALVGGIKEAFGVVQGQWTRSIALGLGLLFTLGTDVRLLSEYGNAAEWLDVGTTALVIGLGLPTAFHKATQAVAAR